MFFDPVRRLPWSGRPLARTIPAVDPTGTPDIGWLRSFGRELRRIDDYAGLVGYAYAVRPLDADFLGQPSAGAGAHSRF